MKKTNKRKSAKSEWRSFQGLHRSPARVISRTLRGCILEVHRVSVSRSVYLDRYTNYPQNVSHYDYVALRSRCSWHVRSSSALYVIGKRVLLAMLLFPLCSTGHRSVTERLPGLNIFTDWNFAKRVITIFFCHAAVVLPDHEGGSQENTFHGDREIVAVRLPQGYVHGFNSRDSLLCCNFFCLFWISRGFTVVESGRGGFNLLRIAINEKVDIFWRMLFRVV